MIRLGSSRDRKRSPHQSKAQKGLGKAQNTLRSLGLGLSLVHSQQLLCGRWPYEACLLRGLAPWLRQLLLGFLNLGPTEKEEGFLSLVLQRLKQYRKDKRDGFLWDSKGDR